MTHLPFNSSSLTSLPNLPTVTANKLQNSSGFDLYYTGPSLEKGPLPAFFYFALEGEESLCLDPINQPVAFLSNTNIRIFSFTIPSHQIGYSKSVGLLPWAEKICSEEDILTPFFESITKEIKSLIEKEFIQKNAIALGGLSRGAFIASQLAARLPEVQYLLGFSPVTQLENLKDFLKLGNNPLSKSFNLKHLNDKLYNKQVRFYIGNRDVRVQTDACYSFIRELVETAYSQRIRSPQIELLITPSIGHHGHGSTPSIFYDGAMWIKEKLCK